MFSWMSLAFSFLKNVNWKTLASKAGYIILIILAGVFAYKWWNVELDYTNYKLEMTLSDLNDVKHSLTVVKKNVELTNKFDTEINDYILEMEKLKDQHSLEIKDVVEKDNANDGACSPGLGVNSVQYINKALGYD